MSFREVLKIFPTLVFCGNRIRRVKPNNCPFPFFLFILIIRGSVFIDIKKSLRPESLRAFSYIGTDCLYITLFDDISQICLVIDIGS